MTAVNIYCLFVLFIKVLASVNCQCSRNVETLTGEDSSVVISSDKFDSETEDCWQFEGNNDEHKLLVTVRDGTSCSGVLLVYDGPEQNAVLLQRVQVGSHHDYSITTSGPNLLIVFKPYTKHCQFDWVICVSDINSAGKCRSFYTENITGSLHNDYLKIWGSIGLGLLAIVVAAVIGYKLHWRIRALRMSASTATPPSYSPPPSTELSVVNIRNSNLEVCGDHRLTEIPVVAEPGFVTQPVYRVSNGPCVHTNTPELFVLPRYADVAYGDSNPPDYNSCLQNTSFSTANVHIASLGPEPCCELPPLFTERPFGNHSPRPSSNLRPPTSVTSVSRPLTSLNSATQPPTSLTSATRPPTSMTSATRPPTSLSSATQPPTSLTSATRPPSRPALAPRQSAGQTSEITPARLRELLSSHMTKF